MTRRHVLTLAAVLLLIAVGTAAVRGLGRAQACGADVTSISAKQSSSPFLDTAGRKQQPDEERDRAVASLAQGRPPFGEVVGAVGYHYEQWAQVTSYDQGIGIRTRDNPDFTMLDDRTLRPLWSVQVTTKRSTYDADDRTYLVATMPKESPPDLVALDARTGRRRWCAGLGGPHVGADDAFRTLMLADGGVLVSGPGDGGRERLVRFDDAGRVRWTTEVDADEGDYLGAIGENLVVVGGRAAYELADDRTLSRTKVRTALRGIDLESGRTVWHTKVTSGSSDHVLGVVNGLTVVEERAAGQDDADVVLVDETGQIQEDGVIELVMGPAPDAAVVGNKLVARNAGKMVAFEVPGARMWERTLPTRTQFLPYGFQLDQVPLLDGDHALLGTTTGLRVLDLRSGAFTATAPLPVDGINTTYWPYQVAVSPSLIAVATNTSAVVLRRR